MSFQRAIRALLPKGVSTPCPACLGGGCTGTCACIQCGLDFCSKECASLHVCTLHLEAITGGRA